MLHSSTQRLLVTAACAVLLTTIVGCSDSGTGSTPSRMAVSLQFGQRTNEQRMDIDAGWLELWSVDQGQYTSLGKFRVNFNGMPVDGDGNLIDQFSSPTNLKTASRLAVTYETEPDMMPGTPSNAEILTGEIAGDQIALKFETNYAGIQGQYLVVTPSNGGGAPDVQEEDATDPYSGIWFSARDWGKPGVGLGLPLPPAGWKYEGWYMDHDMRFLSMGKFTNVSMPDETNEYLDDSDMDNVTNNYHFPGEDFLTNPPDGHSFPVDVRTTMTFVTLEPDPDPQPDSPFLLSTLFCATIPAQIATTTKSSQLDVIPLPTATATLH